MRLASSSPGSLRPDAHWGRQSVTATCGPLLYRGIFSPGNTGQRLFIQSIPELNPDPPAISSSASLPPSPARTAKQPSPPPKPTKGTEFLTSPMSVVPFPIFRPLNSYTGPDGAHLQNRGHRPRRYSYTKAFPHLLTNYRRQ